jgi:hypothetical protein
MKNALLIFITLCGLNATAQWVTPITFPTVDGHWTYRYYGDQGEPGDYKSYYTQGDTTINNTNYMKLGTNGQYAGAYRDSNRVVYFIPDTSIIEYVLYDFNLEVGDTIIHPFGNGNFSIDTITVWYTDSIIISGSYHKTISFSSMTEWVEGIGSLNYLLNPYDFAGVSGNDILRCMWNDGSLIYGATNGYCTTSINETENVNSKLTIFPNPANSDFNIQLEEGTIQHVQIMDFTGKIILDHPKVNSKQFTVSKLPPGIYLVNILDNNGHYSIKRMVSVK